MADSSSPLQLLQQLRDAHLVNHPKAYLGQPRLSKRAKKKRLSQVLYNTLFKTLQGPHRNKELPTKKTKEEDSLSTVDKVYSCAFDLRVAGKFNEASSLENLVESLNKDGLKENVKAVLELFLCLRGSVPEDHHVPFVFDPDAQKILDYQLFDCEPGEGLQSYQLLRPKEVDVYEMHLRETLFCGLTHSKTQCIDTILDFPELPDNPELVDFKIPKLCQVSDDEGFAESLDSGESVTAKAEDQDEEDIWQKALTAKRNHYFRWEDIGCKIHKKERPYLTEAGPDAMDHVYTVMQRQLLLLDRKFIPILPQKIAAKDLVKDAINLLIAVPSHSFYFHENEESFSVRPGLHLPGTTPEGLASLCSDLMECGAFYYKLMQFSEPPTINSFYKAGLIFQAFTGALRKYLQHYRAFVLSISLDKTLMELNAIMHKVFHHMRYLSRLCWCDKSVKKRRSKTFPTGVALLTYLYEETLNASGSMFYPMLLALFHSSCGPYLMFVRNWIFHGICNDIYGEFMFQINDEYLRYRDKLYWRRGFQLLGHSAQEVTPVFLKEVANDVFLVGKSINLLQLINPEHFLFSIEHHLPRITVTFSEEGLKSVELRCQMYVSRMQEMIRQHTITREKFIERQEKAKQELIARAQRMAAQEMAKIQARIMEIRKANDQKKRRLFQELKEQMENDLQRRADAVQAEKQRDKELAEEIAKQELLEAKVSKDLLDSARTALMDYYEELSEEAAFREQRAMWHVRRRRLAPARREFLHDEEVKLMALLESIEELADDVIENAGEDEIDLSEKAKAAKLPGWVERGLKDPVEIDHSEDAGLPSWAQKGLRQPETSGYDIQATLGMPGWAKRRLEDGDNALTEHIDSEGESESVAGADIRKDELAANVAKNEGQDMKSLLAQEPGVTDSKPVVKVDFHKRALLPSPDDDSSGAKSIVQNVDSRHVSQQSQEEIHRPHSKTVAGQSASRQTEETEGRQHLKTVAGHYSTKQSTEAEERPHLKTLPGHHPNMESIPQTLKIRKPNFFGHVSQLSSSDYTFPAPKMKRSAVSNALKESDWTCYQVKAHKKNVAGKHISQESKDEVDAEKKAYIPQARPFVGGRHASVQSQEVDMGPAQVQRFKDRNVHGRHASDSSVEQLLYRNQFGKKNFKPVTEDLDDEEFDYELWTEHDLEENQDVYEMLNNPPEVDLISRVARDGSYANFTDYGIMADTDIEAHEFLSLPAIMHRSLIKPIKAQVSLVNQCILDYFFAELQIQKHFEMLSNFYLMQDGEFALSLTNQLFEKLEQTSMSHELLNPMFLGNVLNQARQASIHRDSKYATNISFTLKDYPSVMSRNRVDMFNCLTLVYKVDWPLNIVITDTCLVKYNLVFSFILQLKRAVWSLKDISNRLKRDCVIHQAIDSQNMHKLQLFRHEMQHFVHMMQGYITNQILHVTWHQFQQSLRDVKTLDNLHSVHAHYLNTCLFRCLLNPKAAPVMKIIQDIFTLILKFHSQLTSQSWERKGQDVVHPAFSNMSASYQSFQDYSKFLFRVVSKLAAKGYQPHLQELLLRLNFNHYYQNS